MAGFWQFKHHVGGVYILELEGGAPHSPQSTTDALALGRSGNINFNIIVWIIIPFTILCGPTLFFLLAPMSVPFQVECFERGMYVLEGVPYKI